MQSDFPTLGAKTGYPTDEEQKAFLAKTGNEWWMEPGDHPRVMPIFSEVDPYAVEENISQSLDQLRCRTLVRHTHATCCDFYTIRYDFLTIC